MVYTFWRRYSANPFRTVVESFQAPIFMIPFPAVTLCPLVPPLAARRGQLLQRLRLPADVDNNTAMFLLKYVRTFVRQQTAVICRTSGDREKIAGRAALESNIFATKFLRYGTAFASERVLGGKNHLNKLRTLLEVNNMTLLELLKFLRPCEDLIESCWWDGEKKNCSEIFRVSHASQGVCCSFNFLLEDYIANSNLGIIRYIKTAFFGPASGLVITLHRKLLVENDGTGEFVKYSTNSVGILVYTHHPLEYLGAIANRHLLQAGQELRVTDNRLQLREFTCLSRKHTIREAEPDSFAISRRQIAVIPYVKKKLSGYSRLNARNELVPHCVKNEAAKLKYLPVYLYSNCFVDCSIEAALRICGCVPFYYEAVAVRYSLKVTGSRVASRSFISYFRQVAKGSPLFRFRARGKSVRAYWKGNEQTPYARFLRTSQYDIFSSGPVLSDQPTNRHILLKPLKSISARYPHLQICDWENFNCLYENADNIRVIQESRMGNFTCRCYSPCLEVFYDSRGTTVVLNRHESNVWSTHKNMSDAQAIMTVFMSYQTFTSTDTIPSADELYLLASVGGIFSLFLGCSFLSVVEIFYFVGLYIRSYRNSKKPK
ncbi:LOW QUALITY PROTEIN: sodium channel protein Nach [Harpegnathos saltator]|uniref:LOW QUALITY PROTEIN: sodium channel protein Nach n=1 Tax=Harpegnathos saltator TaxID=610380 RepID=UPI000DBED5A8|nr:LOW QUALITY PROTEIN: sodium channel protein Nach [Harpegnathos saltator]